MHTCDRRMGRRCPTQQRPVLGTCLLCHSWFSGCRARAAQTGEPRLARPWTATCTWGHRVCSKSGRRDAVCRQEGIPGTRGMQGRHGARRLAGQQDICHAAGSARADATPLRTAVRSRATHLGMAHPGAAGLQHTQERLPASPGIFPPTSSCHLCALQTLPQDYQNLPQLATTTFPPMSHHRRTSGSKLGSVPLPLVPFPTPAEIGRLLLLPRWLERRWPASQGMPAGLHHAQAPTRPWL